MNNRAKLSLTIGDGEPTVQHAIYFDELTEADIQSMADYIKEYWRDQQTLHLKNLASKEPCTSHD